MKAQKGPSATTLSLMIVGAYATPFVLVAATVAGLFLAILSQ